MADERSWPETGLRWLLALAFAVAAGLKLAQVPQDAGWAAGMGVGGAETMFSALPPVVRMGVVTLELALAGLLVSPHFRRASAAGAAVLVSGFLAAIMYELTKADPRACGCFGTEGAATVEGTRRLLWVSLGMDLALLSAAAGLLWMARRGD